MLNRSALNFNEFFLGPCDNLPWCSRTIGISDWVSGMSWKQPLMVQGHGDRVSRYLCVCVLWWFIAVILHHILACDEAAVSLRRWHLQLQTSFWAKRKTFNVVVRCLSVSLAPSLVYWWCSVSFPNLRSPAPSLSLHLAVPIQSCCTQRRIIQSELPYENTSAVVLQGESG